jgi:hypothetical protein
MCCRLIDHRAQAVASCFAARLDRHHPVFLISLALPGT